jgi:hypothetical protein
VIQYTQETKSIGDEFLALEKYVNLNYMGFHKILVGWQGGWGQGAEQEQRVNRSRPNML